MSDCTPRQFGFGGAAGIGAYLFGYLVTYLLAADSIRESVAQRLVQFVTGDPATWKMVGWVFYNTHLVKTSIPGPFGQNAVNLLEQSDGPSAVLYLLPVLLLLAAGAVAAELAGADTPTRGAKVGASVTLAYFPLAVGGAFLFSISLGDATAAPALVTSVLLAGLVYPGVFGALGGWARLRMK